MYGGSTPSRQSHDGDDTSKLDSQDFSGIDLGLKLDQAGQVIVNIPDHNSDLESIVGRRESTTGRRSLSGFPRDKSLDPIEADFPPMDLDLGLDLPEPELEDVRPRRESRSESQ
jgi:cohesin complex subunit SCC1